MTSAAPSVQPPRPLLPVPTRQQLAWQRDEMLMFVHFGLKTYYVDGDHKGSGTDSPDKFNPERFDARQWVKVARAAGFRGIILTAKHHDGFCNWPTTSTDYSVAATPWKNGRGDVVRELADACREGGLKLGLYLSVWDMHYLSARLDPERYGDYYAEQLIELLVNYGKVDEVWFDGHGADNMTMDWGRNKEIVRRLQPDSVVFDSFVFGNRENFCLRWPGNEEGCAPEPNWSVFPSPDSSAPGPRIWYPCEADTIMQGCWFWNDKPPCPLNRLKDIYFSSVGRNAVLLLNVAPDPSGRICDAAVERLSEFRAWLDRVFARNLAAGAKVMASQVRGGAGLFAADNVFDSDPDTYWATDDGTAEATLELELSAPAEFSVALIQEPVARGQRVAAHRLEIRRDNAWHKIAEGTTIGHKRLHRFDTVRAQRIRLVLAKSLAAPAISAFGLYHDR